MVPAPDDPAGLTARLRASLPAAMRARDAAAVAALRSALAAIDNAGAVAVAAPERLPVEHARIAGSVAGAGAAEAARAELDEPAVRAIVEAEIAEREEAAALYERHGRDAEAARLRAEAGALAAHLTAGPSSAPAD